ncbi:penicillin acylase family protein [Permianibacter sp. IMCC34836]|uniref:penicillin acylase family protein n=1 Tax=Permianibacter fluminis TaxID=2738515 RepID=UPI0015528E08|nr:penicillin acylase family protein [Permianibacter fluminis]NQD37279.1 penicillin acylase family protein [Permianibacter fluminis]
MKRLLRPFLLSSLLILVLAGAALLWAYWQLDASLPLLDGRLPVKGLQAEVSISRDALGTATLRGRDRVDVARALGFVHAQERFFQMDLLRRRAAGELSALVGKAALDVDKSVRRHRLRWRAEQIVASLPPDQLPILNAYVDGVNAGLDTLAEKPFEYFLLASTPQRWQAADTILAAYAMYLTLQASDGEVELTRLQAKQHLPAALYNFLRAPGSDWDAPLFGEALQASPLPDAASLANWQARLDTPIWDAQRPDAVFPGSNNWAVAGQLTHNGAAMLENDMHLGLQVPNIWFRTRLQYGSAEGERDVVGVSLPGTPMMIVGSNGQVAWGFTNSYGDYSDVISLEQPDPAHYQTPEGLHELAIVKETIAVKGEQPVALTIEETMWGPVIHTDADGKRYAFRWVAHDTTQAVNFGLLEIERSQNVLQALQLAKQARVPSQNFVAADRDGNIGWTIIGAIPRRIGFSGTEPVSWASGGYRWDGYREPDEYPEVLNPLDGRIWTANARVVSGDALNVLGDGGYDFGARAKQIRDDLRSRQQFSETDLLDVALDDRAPVLDRWQQHLLTVLDDAAVQGHPLRAEAREQIAKWRGRATADSVDYRLVRGFRYLLRDALYRAWLHELYAINPELKPSALSNHWEGLVWQVLQQQPPQFLPQGYANWHDFELAVVDALLGGLTANGHALTERDWGDKNTAAIRHPLSRFVPLVGRYLDAPAEPLPGDANMPRVQAPAFGSSERMIVSPGHEANGLFHMPGGQSGHPLSPFYLSGHEAWVKGQPTPLLPGEPVHTLVLQPEIGMRP